MTEALLTWRSSGVVWPRCKEGFTTSLRHTGRVCYDGAAGRTTNVPTEVGTTTLAYNYEGRITTITYPNSSTNTFTYNGLDTRVGKVDSTGTKTYKRDGAYVTDPVLSDSSASYTPGISERRSSTTKFYHTDRLGTTERLTNTSQTTTDTREYDAFGLLVSSSGSTPTPFGFAGAWGYQEDPDSGLKLLGHRYYDPSTGRFLTRDPAKDGCNWYAYCSSAPTCSFDDDGNQQRKITGFTKHGLNQIIGRDGGVGVSNKAVLQAVTEGEIRPNPSGGFKFIGRDAIVVLNKDGKLVTTWPRGSGGIRSSGSGAGIGVIAAIVVGADALFKGVREVVLYRKRLQNHLKAIDVDNEKSYTDEGTSWGR
jgi:RHS repeat-associated protein